MTYEKSSNKCKTLLAKHHFIILHNYVCVLLVNLHRLPLFSFCSLLILLFLCQSRQFFLEQFAGGFPSEHLPWVVVDPVLYHLDIVLCPVIEVLSLRYLPSHQSVLVFVAATLKGAVWVAVRTRSLSFRTHLLPTAAFPPSQRTPSHCPRLWS